MRLCAHSPPAWAHTSPSPPPQPQPPCGTPARGLQTTWQPPCSQPRRGKEPPPQTWQELLGKVSSIQPGRLYRTEPVIRDIGPRSAEPRILQARVRVKAGLPGPSGTPKVCTAPAPPTTPDPPPTNSASRSPAPWGRTHGTLGPCSFSLKSGPERPQSDCSPGSLLLCPCRVAYSGHFVTGTPQHVVLSFGVMFSRALELQVSFVPGDVVVMHMLPGWRARLLPLSIELLGTPVLRAWWICTSISLGATAGLQPAPCPGTWLLRQQLHVSLPP